MTWLFLFFPFQYISLYFSADVITRIFSPSLLFERKLLWVYFHSVRYLTIQSFNINLGFVAPTPPSLPASHTHTLTHTHKHTQTPPLLGYRTSIKPAPSAKPHWAINHIESESSNQSLAFSITHVYTSKHTQNIYKCLCHIYSWGCFF